jgi:hypothetical protein
MRKNLFTVSALAIAAFAIALAPTTPIATAGLGHDFDEEAQQWYDFAHDKAQEINLLHIRSSTAVMHKTYAARCQIFRYCGAYGSRNVDTHRRIRMSIARRAKFAIGKCVWEAQMELDACYDDARQQLEDAGYGYFVTHIYSPYRTTQRHLVQYQRDAQNHLNAAVNCPP